MNSIDFVLETAAKELAGKLPSLKKHDYSAIEDLVHRIAKKHRITKDALRQVFDKSYGVKAWHRGNLDEDISRVQEEVIKFTEWAADILHLKTHPEIELSVDTEEAQSEHHTGRHTEGDNKVWVYVRNRNLVDILRTVFHELVHVRQGEINMIKPGSSYPGSPIEVMADMLAGKYIKIYGEDHPEIFQ